MKFRVQKRRAQSFAMILGAFLFAVLTPSSGQDLGASGCVRTDQSDAGLPATQAHLQTVRELSFPELAGIDLRMRGFHSRADFFRSGFSISRFFLLERMRYFVEVNPALFNRGAPSDGICAVLAHELSHVVSLSHGNRIRRLGLIRLLSRGYTAQFERTTDLEAIHRGYGDGLKSYRTWVYANIPAKALAAKRRYYFSPEEIGQIQERLRDQPDLFTRWSKHVPMNLQEIVGNSR
jgi:hypothetical protein